MSKSNKNKVIAEAGSKDIGFEKILND